MKKVFVALFASLFVVSLAQSQEAVRVDVTSFEDLTEAYSGSSILGSFVESPLLEEGVVAQDGDAALYVDFDNSVNGAWQWAQMDFAGVEASGMTEVHMWVYWFPGSVANDNGNYEIQIQLVTSETNHNLGFQSTNVTGEWVELVWPISSFISANLGEVFGFGGFIHPANESYAGQLYIDNVYFYRPEGTPEVESVLVYDFDETDPDTLFSVGWASDDESAQPLFPGEGEVDPSQGTNYMTFPLTGGWATNIHTIDAQSAFDRWDEVREIWLDARTSGTSTNWGPQTAIVLQSDSGGWDQYGENSYQDSVDGWTLLTWPVDMSGHAESLANADGSFSLRFSTNNDAANEGMICYFDNLRVVVPVESDVTGWSLY